MVTSVQKIYTFVCILPMRDWNFVAWVGTKGGWLFVSYLWGIETGKKQWPAAFSGWFVSYLWGIETYIFFPVRSPQSRVCILPMRDWNFLSQLLSSFHVSPFVSYLWGIETNEKSMIFICQWSVCILPMRDWNFSFLSLFLATKNRLYLTYEGLKPLHSPGCSWRGSGLYLTYEGLKHAQFHRVFALVPSFVSYLWRIETVHPSEYLRTETTSFVSYLWGIETPIHGLYPAKVLHVCILPMRDWNIFLGFFPLPLQPGLYLTYEGLKREKYDIIISKLGEFVSYLWEIETPQWPFFFNTSIIVCILPMRDWNSERATTKSLLLFSLYLTYEGLKHVQPTVTEYLSRRVCILPMRDWNTVPRSIYSRLDQSLYLTYEGLKLRWNIFRILSGKLVCILPMRDWNMRKRLQPSAKFSSLYLTYEGLKPRFLYFRIPHPRLYLTYEGLKHLKHLSF